MSTAATSPPDVDEFPPTLREVMLRPQWIGMLGLSLVVAAVFAWLGQWQLERAIDTDPPPPGITEELRPIDEVVAVGQYLPEPFVGQQVRLSGEWVPGDFLIVSSRFNDDVEGYWVTGQLRLTDPPRSTPTSIAVAIGWTADRADAERAAAVLDAQARERPQATTILGRLVSDEGPGLPPAGADPSEQTRMSPAALLSRWHDVDGVDVYRPYLVSFEADAGLTSISSPAPEPLSPVNWLNIFYAAEWVVFAGFAFYLWYRLARDAWEKELEAHEDALAAQAAGGEPEPAPTGDGALRDDG